MANRRDEASRALKKKVASTPAPPPAAPRKRAAAKAAPAPEAPPATAPENGAKGLLHAGLKALGNVRDDVVKRQNNMIDSLLGAKPKSAAAPQEQGVLPRSLAGLDPFGIRKFEDVFDQRVATALQHLGMPSPQEWQSLREEVKLLREQLHPAQPEPVAAPRRKR